MSRVVFDTKILIFSIMHVHIHINVLLSLEGVSSFDLFVRIFGDFIFFDFFFEDSFHFLEIFMDIRNIFPDPDKNFPDIDFLSSSSKVSNILYPLMSGLMVENLKDILFNS